MSGLLFLVRLHADYRMRWDGLAPSHAGRGPVRTFKNRASADAYAGSHYPIDLNPFVDGGSSRFSAEATPYMESVSCWEGVGTSENELWLFTLPVTFLCEWIKEVIGALPPDIAPRPEGMSNIDRQRQIVATFVNWWQESSDQLSDEQRREVWHLLAPNAYEVIEVEAEDC